MNFKQLNEKLDKVLNEISYETKKSYLAKRQAQLDDMQAKVDRAKRLVADTEQQKQGKKELSDEQLEQLLNDIDAKGDLYFGNKRFYKSKWYRNWGYLEAGEVDGESNSCRIALSQTDTTNVKYIMVNVSWRDRYNKKYHWQESLSADEYTYKQLVNEIYKMIKNWLDKYNKQYDKDSKIINKRSIIVGKIKDLLSKVKQNVLDPEKVWDKKVLRELGYANIGPNFLSVVSLPNIRVSSPEGFDYDTYIHAIGLYKDLTISLFSSTQDDDSINIIKSNEISASQEEKNKFWLKIYDVLKEQIQDGKSGLKSLQNKLNSLKEQAKEAIKKYKSAVRSADKSATIDSIEENGTSYEFLTHDFGDWGTPEEWEDDDDFMKPTDSTYSKLDKICSDLGDKYPDLKFSYDVSEKRMLTCSVSF